MNTTPGPYVLIIEDDAQIAESIAEWLGLTGFVSQIASNGAEGLRQVRKRKPDLILLDLSLPDYDGITLCRQIRKASGRPIIIVSGRTAEWDRIEGLETGADDYISKPFSLPELTARIHAVLRRIALAPATMHAALGMDLDSEETPKTLVVGNLQLNLTSCRVEIGGQTVGLTSKEFRILAVLMRQPDHIFSREALREQVWQNPDANLHLVEVHIANIRAKIEDNPKIPKRLVTVREYGYKVVET